MAKLSRNSLKALVKECLVEILAEGIGSAETITELRRRPAASKKRTTKRVRDPQHKVENVDKKFDKAVEKTAASLTNDSIMQGIFADTAKTTLQEQNNRDTASRVGGQPSSSLTNSAGQPGVDLGGIFDSASQNWSSLAFSENKTSERNN